MTPTLPRIEVGDVVVYLTATSSACGPVIRREGDRVLIVTRAAMLRVAADRVWPLIPREETTP